MNELQLIDEGREMVEAYSSNSLDNSHHGKNHVRNLTPAAADRALPGATGRAKNQLVLAISLINPAGPARPLSSICYVAMQ